MNENTYDVPRPPGKSRRVDWNELIWGLGLMVVGLFLTLQQLDYIESVEFWRYTPAVLVTLAVIGMARSSSAKEREGSWWLLIGGIYMWINFFEIGGLGWGTSWPVILILIGLAKLIDPENFKERQSSGLFLCLGAFFLIAQGEFFGLDYGDVWPLAIIAVGVAMTWRALFRDPRVGEQGGAK